jgi:hypothetical protein
VFALPLAAPEALDAMTVDEAREVTATIRRQTDRAWNAVEWAFFGRAWEALGHPSWDAYVDAELGDLRLTVPREDRDAVVRSLAATGMSVRAVAAATGVSKSTVARVAGVPNGTPEPGQDKPSPIGAGPRGADAPEAGGQPGAAPAAPSVVLEAQRTAAQLVRSAKAARRAVFADVPFVVAARALTDEQLAELDRAAADLAAWVAEARLARSEQP